jgi:hypothetical protein
MVVLPPTSSPPIRSAHITSFRVYTTEWTKLNITAYRGPTLPIVHPILTNIQAAQYNPRVKVD